jgi:hypothetical protein
MNTLSFLNKEFTRLHFQELHSISIPVHPIPNIFFHFHQLPYFIQILLHYHV